MKKHSMEQGSPEWFQARKGKITGTVLKAIMGTKSRRQDAIYEIIAQRLTLGVEKDVDPENPMARGNRLEPDAIKMFEFETNMKVDRIGLAEMEDDASMAQSPDGLIGDDAAIEVKCMGGKNHVKMWLTDQIPDDYYWQVVQYFVVNPELKKLYFVGYNPDIPMHKLHIITVDRASIETSIKEAHDAEKAFLMEVNSILSTLIKM